MQIFQLGQVGPICFAQGLSAHVDHIFAPGEAVAGDGHRARQPHQLYRQHHRQKKTCAHARQPQAAPPFSGLAGFGELSCRGRFFWGRRLLFSRARRGGSAPLPCFVFPLAGRRAALPRLRPVRAQQRPQVTQQLFHGGGLVLVGVITLHVGEIKIEIVPQCAVLQHEGQHHLAAIDGLVQLPGDPAGGLGLLAQHQHKGAAAANGGGDLRRIAGPVRDTAGRHPA